MSKKTAKKTVNKRWKMSVIMSNAWSFVRDTGMGIGEAMHTAYLNWELRGKMLHGVVRFRYIKKDGRIRDAIGTLAGGVFDLNINGSGRRTPSHCQCYWDMEAENANGTDGAFRCFIKANLVEVGEFVK